MKFKYNDVEIDYVVYGEGRPILVIHGYGVDKRCVVNSVEPLAGKLEGIKRYYIDLPHMGKSNWPKSINSSDDYLRVVERFVDECIPDLVGVVGYSYGGYLAMGIQQKISSLPAFLLCSVTEPNRNKRVLPDARVIFVDEYIKNLKEVKIGYDRSTIQTKEKYERALLDFEDSPKLANIEKLTEIIRSNYKFSFKINKSVSGKTCALFGRLDEVVGFKDFWEIDHVYENVDVFIVDHAGHYLPIEQPEMFEEIFMRWVRVI